MDAPVTADSEIVFERRGRVGRILLNRPKALNALTKDMCDALLAQLQAWRTNMDVQAVVIRGAGEKAFCAGGDIVQLYEGGRAKDGSAPAFWRVEYICNTLIRTFPKPYIALVDGIVMGGGVGVSVHGSHRVVSDKTVFAMPETGIGLFPDVGGSYFLPRLPGRMGVYLGLTGKRLKGADCLAVGAADAFVPRAQMDALEASLAADATTDRTRISDIISAFSQKPAGETVMAQRALIDRHFAAPTVEGIFESLAADGDPWAAGTLKDLHHKSPTSLKVTLRQLQEGGRLSFEDCMRMEWRMANRAIVDSDFLEGVRALLVDKDMKPVWRPGSIAEVTREKVDAFFAPRPGDELDLSRI
jgi:enoyl-CoA hydratase